MTLNPDEYFVAELKRRIKDNGNYCLYEEKGDKKNKCPKPCKHSDECPCGMYIKENIV